ncbi:unnamed protein product, partial [Ectocarpus sp. 8 AP-2014]
MCLREHSFVIAKMNCLFWRRSGKCSTVYACVLRARLSLGMIKGWVWEATTIPPLYWGGNDTLSICNSIHLTVKTHTLRVGKSQHATSCTNHRSYNQDGKHRRWWQGHRPSHI